MRADKKQNRARDPEFIVLLITELFPFFPPSLLLSLDPYFRRLTDRYTCVTPGGEGSISSASARIPHGDQPEHTLTTHMG